jgi:hypothetical protein
MVEPWTYKPEFQCLWPKATRSDDCQISLGLQRSSTKFKALPKKLPLKKFHTTMLKRQKALALKSFSERPKALALEHILLIGARSWQWPMPYYITYIGHSFIAPSLGYFCFQIWIIYWENIEYSSPSVTLFTHLAGYLRGHLVNKGKLRFCLIQGGKLKIKYQKGREEFCCVYAGWAGVSSR